MKGQVGLAHCKNRILVKTRSIKSRRPPHHAARSSIFGCNAGSMGISALWMILTITVGLFAARASLSRQERVISFGVLAQALNSSAFTIEDDERFSSVAPTPNFEPAKTGAMSGERLPVDDMLEGVSKVDLPAQCPVIAEENAIDRSLPDTLPAQLAAMKKYPELSRYGSPFNREFLQRVARYTENDPAFLQNANWPLAVADEVAASGVASSTVAPESMAGCVPTPGRVRLPSWPEWNFLKAYREGDDIVVPNAIATVFGWDSRLGVRDPNDNGDCASGYGTRSHPGILGCALPVSIARRSTIGSPFPKYPWLPWLSAVEVTCNGRSITVPLIDNGPSAPTSGDRIAAGIDLTPAACLALGVPLEDIRRNRVAVSVSFRLPGAARRVAWN